MSPVAVPESQLSLMFLVTAPSVSSHNPQIFLVTIIKLQRSLATSVSCHRYQLFGPKNIGSQNSNRFRASRTGLLLLPTFLDDSFPSSFFARCTPSAPSPPRPSAATRTSTRTFQSSETKTEMRKHWFILFVSHLKQKLKSITANAKYCDTNSTPVQFYRGRKTGNVRFFPFFDEKQILQKTSFFPSGLAPFAKTIWIH